MPPAEAASRSPADCDVLVVGGGINGAGIARDLAGRGWRVTLCEQDDLGSHTSSASTKLVHGGLRYLEHREFALVRKALREREVLLRSAPHIMWPLRFVMPHDPSMRPAWVIRAGLFLYDHLARRDLLPGSTTVALRRHVLGQCLQPRLRRAFVYSDGWVDDARLVVLNAVAAREHGARVLPGTRCTAAQRTTGLWAATLRSSDGQLRQVRARALVNAAGPWADRFLRDACVQDGRRLGAERSLRLIKGSHIVVPRMFEHDHAYVFQNADKRIIFAIPYEQRFTLIGTTDVELQGGPGDVRIDTAETQYLCEQASRYFARPVTPADVVWSYSGVRPLLDEEGDPSAVTRDYQLEVDGDGPPLLTVWGGKITTFRKLSEEAADALGTLLGEERPRWTEKAALPGGDLRGWVAAPGRPDTDFAQFVAELGRRQPWLPAATRLRLARAYGSRVALFLGATAEALGEEIAPGLHEAELRYLQQQEWACTGEDVLWRRSKLGLHFTPAQRDCVHRWMGDHRDERRVA